VASLLVFLGQAGTSIKGAYDVLVSMSIIAAFVPYLFVFAAMFRLQNEPAPSGIFRVPGGKPFGKFVACVGFTTTALTILVSLAPSPDETNKLLAVVKIVGLTGMIIGMGWLLYFLGNRKRRAAAAGA
jgi:amino acid transporter